MCKASKPIGSFPEVPFEVGSWPYFVKKKVHLEYLERWPRIECDQDALYLRLGGNLIDLALSARLKPHLGADPVMEGASYGIPESLTAVNAHIDAGEGLRRYKFRDIAYHAALHVIHDARATNPDYCQIHNHQEEQVAELNVIIPCQEEGLVYDIYAGDSWRTIEMSSNGRVLWFPPAMPHCVLAREGSGLLFVARFPATNTAQN